MVRTACTTVILPIAFSTELPRVIHANAHSPVRLALDAIGHPPHGLYRRVMVRMNIGSGERDSAE